MNRKGWMMGALSIVMSLSLSASVMAQQQGGFQGQGQGQGGFQGQGARGQGGFNQGQPQNFDPAEIQRTIRQSRADAIREALASSEEEWAVLGPKIERINGLNADATSGMTGMMNLFGRRGGGGRGRGGALGGLNLQTMLGGSNAMAQKMQDLQEAIDNAAMPESEIKSRLAAVRAERERVRAELAKARAELVQLLTQRQEAILFTMGILE